MYVGNSYFITVLFPDIIQSQVKVNKGQQKLVNCTFLEPTHPSSRLHPFGGEEGQTVECTGWIILAKGRSVHSLVCTATVQVVASRKQKPSRMKNILLSIIISTFYMIFHRHTETLLKLFSSLLLHSSRS